ncbi:MAG: hypothetical protein COA41_04575 [Sphingopyxis sp.]|nr:MAG: hypothetical protein COA41_04575 [Sphingopyxis sp.]
MAERVSALVRSLAARPALAAMPAAQIRIIVALRMAVLASQNKQNPGPCLARQLGDEEAAIHFFDIIETMSDCWPDPIAVHRPCCRETSYDEILLIDLITAVVQGQTGPFHALLGEMIARTDRLKLHRSIERFVSRFTRQG